jgi:hypothetical protein
LLSDGRTSFRYVPAMLITSSAQIALEASAAYGTAVYPSTFAPDCNAYDFAPGPTNGEIRTYSNAVSVQKNGAEAASITATFTRGGGRGAPPLPRAFFTAAVNQPSFTNGSQCDSMTRFFDTPLADGAAPVSARVGARLASVFGAAQEREMVWTDMPGWQVDSAFLESHLASCERLQAHAAAGQACGSGIGGVINSDGKCVAREGFGGSSPALAALHPGGASPEALLEGGLGGGEEGRVDALFQELRGVWRGVLKLTLQRQL